jgi:hypothetical protein
MQEWNAFVLYVIFDTLDKFCDDRDLQWTHAARRIEIYIDEQYTKNKDRQKKVST